MLEVQFPQTVETQPELLAHHYTEASLLEQAIPYWQKAGQRASQRSANVEAISHLTKGLELLKTLPDTPERTHQELSLQIALGHCYRTKGCAAPEVERAYTRARELCQQIEGTPQLFSVLTGLWGFYLVRARATDGPRTGGATPQLGPKCPRPGPLRGSLLYIGDTLFDLGEFGAARAAFRAGSCPLRLPATPFPCLLLRV